MARMERHRSVPLVALVLLSAVVAPVVAAGGLASGGFASGGDLADGLSPDAAATSSLGSDWTAAGGGPAVGSSTVDAVAGGPAAAGVGGPAGTDAAANGLAQFSMEPTVVAAAPGQTVSLAIVLRSSPQIASGAYKAGFVLEYNASVLRATNISRGPFMDRQQNTTVRTNQSAVNNQEGFILYELVRDPPAGGVTGFARFAVVTFEVREDAPPGSYTVAFFRTLVLLTDENFQRVTTSGAEVDVDPSVVTATATSDATPTAGGPTTADGSTTPTATRTSGGGGDGGGGDGGSGPSGAIIGVVALLGTLVLLGGVLVLVRRA